MLLSVAAVVLSVSGLKVMLSRCVFIHKANNRFVLDELD